MQKDRLAWAEINLDAYRANLNTLRGYLSKKTCLMAVVKANAYGHGLVEIAKTAVDAGVEYLGVVALYDLKKLRAAGIQIPILILNYLDAESCKAAVDLDAAITVMDAEIIRTLEAVAKRKKKKMRVHIKIDTGMHRGGCDPNETLELASLILRLPNLELEGVFTHLATAEYQDRTFARKQLEAFQECLDVLESKNIHPKYIHAANSAATVWLPEAHFTMVRPGILSYGLSPFSDDHEIAKDVKIKFKPVMAVKTMVVHIRTIEEGESVGYGRTYIAPSKKRIGLLPIGYGDGFRRSPRHLSHVLVRGKRVSVVGVISMDQTCVDLTDVPEAKIGDEVVICGKQGDQEITAGQIGEEFGTTHYEFVTGITERVSRVYLGKR